MSICVAMFNAHKVEQGPRVSSVNGCFNPNSICLGSCIFLLDHKGKYFSMARGCVLG